VTGAARESGPAALGWLFSFLREPGECLARQARLHGDFSCVDLGFRRIYLLNHPTW